ncbi:hypothetical protein Poli38472_014668 [Pythium oligandrum]|uniref:Large ribosomal subunit protein bL34m n=1 Tax=Pythium oligandrum TaxID=41045 RepID=A0A8K1CJA7_PYTOL|nr:hypothetical protein Poli38472_014668 [Pythium oligandrum]|eukprot:TMW63963.1 hypothetical protein Poli38472_014668 [Pythium oligandrum]
MAMLARTALTATTRVRAAPAVSMAVRAMSTATVNQLNGVSPAILMMITPVSTPAPSVIDPFVRSPFVFETNSSLQITQMPEISNTAIECPTNSLNEPLLAVKRTYQPSVLRRKRKHGFRSRRLTIGGRKVLNRRHSKGRWRMSA